MAENTQALEALVGNLKSRAFFSFFILLCLGEVYHRRVADGARHIAVQVLILILVRSYQVSLLIFIKIRNFHR